MQNSQEIVFQFLENQKDSSQLLLERVSARHRFFTSDDVSKPNNSTVARQISAELTVPANSKNNDENAIMGIGISLGGTSHLFCMPISVNLLSYYSKQDKAQVWSVFLPTTREGEQKEVRVQEGNELKIILQTDSNNANIPGNWSTYLYVNNNLEEKTSLYVKRPASHFLTGVFIPAAFYADDFSSLSSATELSIHDISFKDFDGNEIPLNWRVSNGDLKKYQFEINLKDKNSNTNTINLNWNADSK
jgi:hypothetical protein